MMLVIIERGIHCSISERGRQPKVLTCLSHSVEWKVTLNNKWISKDTKPDLVAAPGCYQPRVLRAQLEQVVCRKFPSNRCVWLADTSAVASITKRSQRDLVESLKKSR